MHIICKKPHRHSQIFSVLNEYQGTQARHKCCGCAFDLGVLHAQQGIEMAETDSVLKDIPHSQASTVRHKDAYQAYKLGYLSEMQKTA